MIQGGATSTFKDWKPVRGGSIPFNITVLVAVNEEHNSQEYRSNLLFLENNEELHPLNKIKILA